MGIVVIGAVFVDIKGYPLSTYIPGGRNAGRVEQVHGGVCRNVAEDIANVELRPTFVSLVDDTGSGQDVIDKLARHKVNTRYIQRMPDGMGTWLAVFNNDGDVCAAISKRPDTTPLTALLKEKGDEIFADCDGVAIEFDLEKETVKQILHYAKKYRKKVYAAVSNMSIAMERRSLLQEIDCFVCNQQEAGLMFSDDYDHLTPDEMRATLAANVRSANIPCMVVTMGEQGAVYARTDGESGMVPAKKVDVIDTTGAGDAFFAGTVIGLTYGKTLAEACEIGSRLAANVRSANIPCMVVTMGEQGAVYARTDGESGMVPAKKVDVIDTTGAGDAFFAGTVIGLTYGKTLAEACEIGSRLAASVICISENVCPRFRPQEFGLDVPVTD